MKRINKILVYKLKSLYIKWKREIIELYSINKNFKNVKKDILYIIENDLNEIERYILTDYDKEFIKNLEKTLLNEIPKKRKINTLLILLEQVFSILF